MIPTTFVTSKDGTLIAVSEHGTATGTPILFIHGFSFNSDIWYQQLRDPAFAAFRFVTMDMRGHGYSAKPRQVTAYSDGDRFAEDVRAVIEALELDRPVLAGWSFGGVVLFKYVQKFGDAHIRGAVLIDSVACPNDDTANTISERLKQTPAMADFASADADANMRGIEMFSEIISGGHLSPEETILIQSMMLTAPHFVLAGTLAVPSISYGEVMSALTIPVLIQQGSADPVLVEDALAIQQQLIKRQTTRLYPGAVHLPMILAAKQFNHDLLTWLLSETTFQSTPEG